MAGDAEEPGEALVAGALERRHRVAPLLEHGQRRHAVELVEVEVVGLEAPQRLLQLRPHTVGVAPGGLGAEEQAVADGRDVGADEDLGVAVAGGDVEMVDTGGEGGGEGGAGLVGGGPGEGGSSEDGDGALVSGASEAACLHGPHPGAAAVAAPDARKPQVGFVSFEPVLSSGPSRSQSPIRLAPAG